MNRNITLILSAVTVLILLGVWLYLMFFASPTDTPGPVEGSGEFTEFDQFGSDAPSPGPNSDEQSDSNGNTGGESDVYDPDILRQLTTRNVIGHKEVLLASTSHIMYMESGVGHIYSINLETGVEERVSATTVPDARQAVFSSTGEMVVVKTGDSTGFNPISLGKINHQEKTLTLTPVAENVGIFNFSNDDNLLYTIASNSSLLAIVFDLKDQSHETIFETPFREASVVFGNEDDGPHYFYPKTSYLLEGFVYRADGNVLTRLPIDGFGLTSNVLDDVVLTSYRNQIKLVTTLYDQTENEIIALDEVLLPSKCVSKEDDLYCAVPKNKQLQYDSINKWQQGIESFSDNLWSINDSSVELIDITNHSGRSVDVVNGSIGTLSNDWYFQNKIDNTLWIYELSRLTDNVENDTEEDSL